MTRHGGAVTETCGQQRLTSHTCGSRSSASFPKRIIVYHRTTHRNRIHRTFDNTLPLTSVTEPTAVYRNLEKCRSLIMTFSYGLDTGTRFRTEKSPAGVSAAKPTPHRPHWDPRCTASHEHDSLTRIELCRKLVSTFKNSPVPRALPIPSPATVCRQPTEVRRGSISFRTVISPSFTGTTAPGGFPRGAVDLARV